MLTLVRTSAPLGQRRDEYALTFEVTGMPNSRSNRSMSESFRRFAQATSAALGSAWAFWAAVLIVAVWAMLGPYFDYSDAWQLIINTGTTIGTFLMVFILQNTQIRETKAVNVKLDELLRAIEGARTGLVNVDTLPDEELDRLCRELQRLGRAEGLTPLTGRNAGCAVPEGAPSTTSTRPATAAAAEGAESR